jgi:hypothetical protein
MEPSGKLEPQGTAALGACWALNRAANPANSASPANPANPAVSHLWSFFAPFGPVPKTRQSESSGLPGSENKKNTFPYPPGVFLAPNSFIISTTTLKLLSNLVQFGSQPQSTAPKLVQPNKSNVQIFSARAPYPSPAATPCPLRKKIRTSATLKRCPERNELAQQQKSRPLHFGSV